MATEKEYRPTGLPQRAGAVAGLEVHLPRSGSRISRRRSSKA